MIAVRTARLLFPAACLAFIVAILWRDFYWATSPYLFLVTTRCGGAQAWIHGRWVRSISPGKERSLASLPLSSGGHRLELRRESRTPIVREVEITQGEQSIEIDCRP